MIIWLGLCFPAWVYHALVLATSRRTPLLASLPERSDALLISSFIGNGANNKYFSCRNGGVMRRKQMNIIDKERRIEYDLILILVARRHMLASKWPSARQITRSVHSQSDPLKSARAQGFPPLQNPPMFTVRNSSCAIGSFKRFSRNALNESSHL